MVTPRTRWLVRSNSGSCLGGLRVRISRPFFRRGIEVEPKLLSIPCGLLLEAVRESTSFSSAPVRVTVYKVSSEIDSRHRTDLGFQDAIYRLTLTETLV